MAYLPSTFGYSETDLFYCTQTNDIHKKTNTCDKYKAMPCAYPDISLAELDAALDDAQYILKHVEKIEKISELFR